LPPLTKAKRRAYLHLIRLVACWFADGHQANRVGLYVVS
jgi:hypothetical protein